MTCWYTVLGCGCPTWTRAYSDFSPPVLSEISTITGTGNKKGISSITGSRTRDYSAFRDNYEHKNIFLLTFLFLIPPYSDRTQKSHDELSWLVWSATRQVTSRVVHLFAACGARVIPQQSAPQKIITFTQVSTNVFSFQC